VASLRDLQGSFAAALRNPSANCAVLPHGNLSIYRNNSFYAHQHALELTFPVLRRRVGDEYFAQLASNYRERFPSRSGDLHWMGSEFAAFLANHLRGSEYAWLSDLARLEWARHQAAVAVARPSVGAELLARFAPEQLEHLVFALQPSLYLLASDFPVFSVWSQNQVDNAPPVDQSLGSESGMVRARAEGAEVRLLDPPLFSYLNALAAGAPLGIAISTAGFDQPSLVSALGFLFTEHLVCQVRVETEG
jgi:hypothetical protein